MPGLYIHIPFCRAKCGYCDFVSFPNVSSGIINTYLRALSADSSRYRDARVNTIYIGGGTPSILNLKQIEKLFLMLKKDYMLQNPSEITFEANPESVSRPKLKLLKSSGVTRLSLGFQSFNGRFLKMLGRVHNAVGSIRAYRTAREEGFDNINIDLISGLPFQKLGHFKQDLESAVKLAPEHISVYDLTLHNSCRMRGMKKNIDAEEAASMYLFTEEFLEKFGYSSYEVSNYAKTAFQCAHNKNYWENGDYIGLGCSAWSHLEGERWRNSGNLPEYLGSAAENKFKKYCREKLLGGEKRRERFIAGLRMSAGISYDDEDKRLFRRKLAEFESEKYIVWRKKKVYLTRKGLNISNSILCEL